MRIARLLIYEGTNEALKRHFGRLGLWVKPGTTIEGDGGNDRMYAVKISEDWLNGAGGRVVLLDEEIAAIKVVK